MRKLNIHKLQKIIFPLLFSADWRSRKICQQLSTFTINEFTKHWTLDIFHSSHRSLHKRGAKSTRHKSSQFESQFYSNWITSFDQRGIFTISWNLERINHVIVKQCRIANWIQFSALFTARSIYALSAHTLSNSCTIAAPEHFANIHAKSQFHWSKLMTLLSTAAWI